MEMPNVDLWKKIGTTVGLAAVVLLTIIIFWQNNEVTFFVLLFVSLAIFSRSKNKTEQVGPYIVGAVTGAVTEALLIRYGVLQYSNETFIGIPLWLPPLWGLAALLLLNVSRWCTTK